MQPEHSPDKPAYLDETAPAVQSALESTAQSTVQSAVAAAPASSAPQASTLEPATPVATVAVPAHTFNQLTDLLTQHLKDQRRSRRIGQWFKGILLALVAFAIIWPLTHSSSETSITEPHVAVIRLEGTIEHGGPAAAEPINAALQSAFEDTASVAVVLRMNSPGGSPVQAALIYDEINRLRAKYKKPIYAVVEEICASGCYYVAAAVDEIYVNPASMVGSVGVLMDGFGATELMKKLGVERRLYTAGANKGMLDPFSPSNPAQQKIIQDMLAQVHQQFIKAVRDGRGASLKETPDTFSGRIYTGEQALTQGLADEFGSLASLARDVVGVDNTVDYSPKENLAERVAKRLGASFGGAFGASAAKSLLSTQQYGVWK